MKLKDLKPAGYYPKWIRRWLWEYEDEKGQ